MWTCLSDLRYAARRLRYSPGFTLVAVLTLAVGIGASTAIFSALNALVFAPIAYPGPKQIMTLAYRSPDESPGMVSFGNISEVRSRSRALEAVAGFASWKPGLMGSSEPEQLAGQAVTADYFRVLGVQPALGHDFNPADDRPGGSSVVIISNGLWRRRFGADAAIVGRPVLLDDRTFLVIGVMPASFENVVAPSAEVWSLLQLDPALPTNGREWGQWLHAIARLRPTTTPDVGRRELDAIARTRVREFQRPVWSTMANGMILTSLQDDLTRDVRPSLYAIAGGVLLVLAIACANVTNLLLARGARRRAELSLRRALGARAIRLTWELLTESLLLAALGGGLALLVAQWTVSLLRDLSPSTLPRTAAIAVDVPTFMFALFLSTLTGSVMGLLPALDALLGDSSVTMQQDTSRRSTRGHHWTRRWLVVGETALALALLTCTGLLLRSVERLFAIPPGFNPSNVLTMQVELASRTRYPGDAPKHRYFDAVLEAVRRVPGVTDAALTSQLPLSGDNAELEVYNGRIEPIPNQITSETAAYRYAVSPHYFETLGIPVRQGRSFGDADTREAPVRPVIISESFARRAFPNQDPIGRHIRFGGLDTRPWDVIVGVVGDVKQTSLAATRMNAFYVETDQWLWSDNSLWLVVRARGDAAALAAAVKRAVWSIDKDQPIVRVATMNERLAASDASRTFVLRLFEAFGLTALLLAALGVYGVLSGSVTERRREFGIRSVLGASPWEILRLVLGQGLALTAVGVVLGIGLSMIASRALVTMLFGVTRLDGITYGAVVGVLGLVSAIACVLPAWRASQIDPAVTLRAD